MSELIQIEYCPTCQRHSEVITQRTDGGFQVVCATCRTVIYDEIYEGEPQTESNA